MESVGNRCCPCPPATARCATDNCPCYTNGKKCNSNCESSKCSSDCINRTIVRCYCSIPTTMIGQQQTTDVKNYSSKSSKEKNYHSEFTSNCIALNCDCFKFREKCSTECSCKGECTNNIQRFSSQPTERPYISCKCGSGKKSCLKNEKCPCKKLFKHCGSTCKCKMDCCNGKFDGDLSKSTKLCFVSPDQDTSAIVVRITATDAYHSFQLEITNEKNPSKHVEEMFYENFINVLIHYTLPVRRIVIYLSKSPCFHQDCEPKCEVLNECNDNKSCAKVLATLYHQIQTYLMDANVQITVKFLFPYVKRGDLFTKQAVLAMIEAGLTVEPIGIKEWGELLRDKNETGAFGEPSAMTYGQCYTMWTTCGMENYVRQTQQYINDGRRTLGLKESYWSSGVHEILKTSLETTFKTQLYFNDIGRRLSKLDEKPATSKPTSRDSTLMGDVVNAFTLQKTSGGDKKSKKKYVSRSNTGPTVLVTKNGQPATTKLTISQSNHEDTNFGVDPLSTDANNFLSLSTVNLAVNDIDGTTQMASLTTTTNNATVDRLLLALSNRNITEEERIEIKNELTTAVENLKFHLNHFMELLERRITTTSL